jgi:PAS domain S-box-containing protein
MGTYEQVFQSAIFRLFRPVTKRPWLLRFGVSFLAIVIASALTLIFPPSTRPYYLYLGATALATWYGGSRPGILAAALSCATGFAFVLLPALAPAEREYDVVRYLGFAGTCWLVFLLLAGMHRIAQALHSSHLRFGGVVQISEDAIMTIDEQQKITLFNPGAEKIFGYRAQDAIGKHINVLLPERYRSAHTRHVQEFGKASTALRPMNARGTIYGRRANGSEFPAEASISRFQVGEEMVMTVRLRDISERHQTEQRLRQMATIVDSSQDAIISEDLNGTIVSWNPGAETMYGYTAAEAIGRNGRMLLLPDSPDEVAVNINTASSGLSNTVETERVRKDGRRIEVAHTISPLRDEHGHVIGLVTIARDITERKRLEEQLLHSQKMEAVGRLAGGIAHDFNNLLSIIVGYAYLIQTSTPEGEPMRESADQIMAASEKAGSLTRQLLAFSRKQVLRPEVLNLNEVTSGIGKLLPRLLGEDVDVRIVQGKDLRHVKADPGQIEQVIMNLVVNARDAMPSGGKLTIETANTRFYEEEARQHGVEPGFYVLLAVSDTGHGMDEATRARIFEPFFTTKEAGKGTGLGLATVYGIVSQSGGYIWVYSEPGEGTTFKVYFPATDAAAGVRRGPARGELSVCGTETILLVEDEEHLRELLSHVLRNNGYKVLSAANGKMALHVVEAHGGPVHLLLTDVVMPEMRGQELAERLARRYPNLPVMYMSGYTDNALIHSGALPPGTCFLQKPFTPDVALRRIRDLLDSVSAGSHSRQQAV